MMIRIELFFTDSSVRLTNALAWGQGTKAWRGRAMSEGDFKVSFLYSYICMQPFARRQGCFLLSSFNVTHNTNTVGLVQCCKRLLVLRWMGSLCSVAVQCLATVMMIR